MSAVHPLESYRNRQKMTRGELARIFEVDRTTIWRWETGKRIPDRTQLRKVAAITEVPVEELLQFSADEPVKRRQSA